MRNRLGITLLTLTLLTGGAAMFLALSAARSEADELARASLARASERTVAELQRLFGPTQGLLATTHEWAAGGLLDVHETEALNARFVPILRRSPTISAILIGTEAGDEYRLRLFPDGRFENRVVRLTDPAFGVARSVLIDYDASGNRLGERVDERPYDPREEAWFRGALSRPETAYWTAPHTLLPAHAPGITVSRVADAPGQRLVVSFEIELLSLNRFTTSERVRDRGWVAVLLGQQVIGLPGPSHAESLGERFASGFPTAEELDVPALVELGGSADGESLRIELDDDVFLGVTQPFDLSPETKLRVLSALPESDVMQRVQQQRDRFLVVVLLSLLVAGAAAYWLSRSIDSVQPRQSVEGLQVGQYKLESRLGEGGMGTVYRASHAMLRRPTAVKLLREDRRGAKDLARFEREVQLTSQLTHPNTIAIYDYGLTPDGAFYYAMEYVEGITLHALVGAVGPLPSARVIHILQQILGSLAEAHQVGLIHRDINPANIMLCERGGVADVVKVLDFGLVKRLSPRASDRDLSGQNQFAGTPLYIAPESVTHPALLDARSDLYSVAAVGYFLLTGTAVFRGKTAVETITQHLKSMPEAPSVRLGRPVAADLERVLLMALAKAPADRPENAREFAHMLETCADAHAWRPEDSRTWWRTHGAVVQQAASAPTQTQPEPPPEALTVDLSRRTANPET